MDHPYEIKLVRIVYFSGSGGTRRIAEAFEKELKERGIDVIVKNLGATRKERQEADPGQDFVAADQNILAFAVHAMDAPRPVYDWIGSADGAAAGRKMAVFSVSGGGEMWPNKGSRNSCIKALERKGFQVVYDRMMCMPANVFIEYSDHLNIWLINAIPGKASRIVDELLAGKEHRTHFGKGAVMDWVSRSERNNCGKFAQKFRITDACTGCGWCEQNCPTSNIKISEAPGKPVFSDHCVFCTSCAYGCPAGAIKADGPFLLKNGFDLKAVERRMAGVEPEPLEKCCKGWLYKGVKDYLLDRY